MNAELMNELPGDALAAIALQPKEKT